jgi:hypothetical protein
MNTKKKLMVVLGAGASVELGMPSVTDVETLFHLWALEEEFALVNNGCQSLYGHIRDKINGYFWNPRSKLAKRTNYEEVLYTIFQLSSISSDENLNFPLNAFLSLEQFPKIRPFGKEKKVTGDDLRHLGSLLIDRLVKEFREQCIRIQADITSEFTCFKDFFSKLRQDYDVAFISLNCDNLVTRACPDLFTGFEPASGIFRPEKVYDRANWDLIYHLHGSVHFDMKVIGSDMHTITWNRDLTSTFCQNSFGRSFQDTPEGIKMPTSVFVAGYGKAYQIQRLPFRTYYSQIDEMSEKSEAFLFLGYGFTDLHLNRCFYEVRKGPRPRPVVVIDWASDTEVCRRDDLWSYNLFRTIRGNGYELASREHTRTALISELKENNEFEVSTNPLYPLSIWYGGFMEACNHYDLIKKELNL